MKRRLYILVPTLSEAQSTFRDMLLARIPDYNIRVLARRGTDIGDLPEATILQKSDMIHGAELGLFLGGLVGLLLGIYLLYFPPEGLPTGLGVILVLGIFGAVFGAWAASFVASSIPNSQLAKFQKAIDQGNFLMMVDVPRDKLEEISKIIEQRHPVAVNRGIEPTIPAFP